jgi:hypothetical protein
MAPGPIAAAHPYVEPVGLVVRLGPSGLCCFGGHACEVLDRDEPLTVVDTFVQASSNNGLLVLVLPSSAFAAPPSSLRMEPRLAPINRFVALLRVLGGHGWAPEVAPMHGGRTHRCSAFSAIRAKRT